MTAAPLPSSSDPRAAAPGEPLPARVRGIFATIAGRYDLVNHVASLGIDRLWRMRAIAMARLAAGARVLDLAAGTGDLSLALLATKRPGLVVSSDFVPEMLAVGRQKAAKAGAAAVAFEVADACALPFATGVFDAATVAFGVRNFVDRAANFREVARVLKPGGRYVILEFSTPWWAPFRALYHFYLRHVVPFWGGLLARDRAAYQYLNDSIRRFPAPEVLAEELRAAGFASAEWKSLTGGIVAVHVATR